MGPQISAGSHKLLDPPATAKIQLAARGPQTGRAESSVPCIDSHCRYVTGSPQETWPYFHCPPQGALTVDTSPA